MSSQKKKKKKKKLAMEKGKRKTMKFRGCFDQRGAVSTLDQRAPTSCHFAHAHLRGNRVVTVASSLHVPYIGFPVGNFSFSWFGHASKSRFGAVVSSSKTNKCWGMTSADQHLFSPKSHTNHTTAFVKASCLADLPDSCPATLVIPPECFDEIDIPQRPLSDRRPVCYSHT